MHRHRYGWNCGGRMTSTEGGSVPNGVRYGEECPLPSRLNKGLGSVVSSINGVRQSPDRKRIWAYFQGHRTLLFVPIWQNLRGTICINVHPTPNSGEGGLVPCPSPVIYTHVCVVSLRKVIKILYRLIVFCNKQKGDHSRTILGLVKFTVYVVLTKFINLQLL